MSDKDQNRVNPESEPDYDSMSLEELDRLMSGGEPAPKEPAPTDEPASETEPVAEEPTSETEPVAEEEPEKEDEPEPEPDPRDLIIQELEARVKHFESLAGRNAGELGFVKQQLRKLNEAHKQTVRSDDDTFDADSEPEPERRTAPRRERSRDDVATWAVSQAVQQAVNDFGRQHPDVAEMQEAIGAYLKQSGYDPSAVLESDSPVEAAKETRRVLEEAYWHSKASTASERRKAAETKRAAQIPQLEKAKRKAAISGTGGAPPPKPQPKTYEQMTLEELEAELQKEYRL